MKKISLIFLCFQGITFAQTSISLDSCIAWSKLNYPLIKQNLVTENQVALNQQAVTENWLPKISFLAQATYNTEVVSFNFPGMNVTFPHDAYITSLGLEQVIIDGGQNKAMHQLEKIGGEIEQQRNEAELYKLIERVNQLYVNILLGRENLNILNLYKTDVENRRKNSAVAVQSGLLLESTLDELDAEVLKTKQSIIESEATLDGLYRTLSFYTNKKMDASTSLSLQPIGGINVQQSIQRPELKLFDLQEQQLEQRFKLSNVYALPRLTVGAAANYGRPGPNFVNQDLRFFGSANLTLRWNASSLYGLKRERKKFEMSKNLVEIQREVFLFNVQANLVNQNVQLAALNSIIETDNDIIAKRRNVTQTAVAQMENGKITVVTYLTQLNAELQAQLNKKVHEIRLMNMISSINATSGIINF
ncbi:MAG: TolC family protein [Fluviicola sp.]|nr:TolC family protein [Fluviicola sp.]